jgi:hypothetical protein
VYHCQQCGPACGGSYCTRECHLKRICRPTRAYIDSVNERQWAIYERYQFDEVMNRKIRVLRKDNLVYKFCQSEQEYLEMCIFYENHQGIVPTLITVDDKAWVLVTFYAANYIPLSSMRNTRVDIQIPLIRALAHFKRNEFGIDILANLKNIGYNVKDGTIIFYENNGCIYRYDSKEEMIFQFLHQLKFRHNRLIGEILSMDEIKQLI